MGDYDVIVVGGGPTGFITALGLAQAGVNVCLMESSSAITESPRACVYHWSMLAGLERLGIREEAERIGYTKDDYRWLHKATGEAFEYDISVVGRITRWPYNIHLGQHMLAKIAKERLRGIPNATVYYLTSVCKITEDADGVIVRSETPSGYSESRARYVVGADGATSTVRRAMGLDFEGFTWPERFIATNLYHDFESGGYLQSNMVIDPQWGAVIVKITRDGLWRCTYMEDSALPDMGLKERIVEAYSHLLPGAGGYKLRQYAPYRMHQRCAPTFRKGRIMLAGDAAHVTNPTGGFGLTTGLFDAYSLWPTLAAVILDGADPALLDTWAAERRAVFLERTDPQARAYKDFVFHACGGPGPKLDAALQGMRDMVRDPEVRFQRLMFTKGLETTSPAER